MNSNSSDYQQICPRCGVIQSQSGTSCRDCGAVLPNAPPAAASVGRQRSAAPLITGERLGLLLKIIVAVAILAGAIGLIVMFLQSVFQQNIDSHPHPDNPIETASQFFTNLQSQQYRQCTRLLVGARKTAMRIDGQSYEPYFERIRRYLIERAAPDFIAEMKIAPHGHMVTFANGIVLTINMDVSQDLAHKSRYGIRGINEFPRDLLPGLGVEAYRRQVNRAMDNIDQLGQPEPDDLTAIIEGGPGQTGNRLGRMIETYPRVRQLDTRHELLDWIILEFPDEHQTHLFLRRLSNNEEESPHLRELARNALPTQD